jgi:hypothetical protein
MGDISYQFFDPLFSDSDADAILRLCERFGSYGMYSEEGTSEPFGEGLQQRHDAVLNFLKTGGRLGRLEDTSKLAARTNYFRETYAYAEPLIEGIEEFLHFEGFLGASRQVHRRPIVRPAIAYANILVPGQELAVHTDVPEFRGANRMNQPQWLLVAAHHSRLFERWRMPIATGVAWFGNPKGGEFVFYPEGAFGRPVALPAKHNTAIVLDTDSCFHGVDRVSEASAEIAALLPGMQLEFAGDGWWRLRDGDREVTRYRWSELRFSVSWKAHCYTDEAEEALVLDHSDDLDRETIIDILVDDLHQRGRLKARRPNDSELALTIIDEYIQFPPADPQAAGADACSR